MGLPGRYFFHWLGFFVVLFLILGGILLAYGWRSSQSLQLAEIQSFKATCLLEFARRAETKSDPPVRWEWKQLAEVWKSQFDSIVGISLVDEVDGREERILGTLPPSWSPLAPHLGEDSSGLVKLKSGERLWAAVPGGEAPPRYRLWVNLGSQTSFTDYLYQHRLILSGTAVGFAVVFLLFYANLGNPKRYLSPMTETLQRSLEHAESPLHLSPSSLPREFSPLAKSLSLILEERQKDYRDKKELIDGADHSRRVKAQHVSLVKNLEHRRENEQTAIEQVQHSLLEANREPVLILDRTRRILGMNENARRVLSLAGQTGTTLRHPDLEPALEEMLASGGRRGSQRIEVKEPYLGKTSSWRVEVKAHKDWIDSSQVQCLIVTLHSDRTVPAGGSETDKDLVTLMAKAHQQSWSRKGPKRGGLEEEERRAGEDLVRLLVLGEGGKVELATLLERFGLAPGEEESSEFSDSATVPGSMRLWEFFHAWFVPILENMAEARMESRITRFEETLMCMEWKAGVILPIQSWFSEADSIRIFRKELLEQALSRMDSKLVWHPSKPNVVSIEVPIIAGERAARRPVPAGT